MKILFTRFPLESAYGGAEVQTLSLMQGLLKRGHAVSFLGSCPTVIGLCKENSLPVAELNIGEPPVSKWHALSFFWRKQKMQKQLENALSEFHDIDAIFMLSVSEKILLTPLALKKGIKVIWIEHDRIGPWLSKNPWLKDLQKMSTDVTTVCVSDLSRDLYEEIGWHAEHTKSIPNGITEPVDFVRKEHKGYRVGCVARLSKDKGVDLLIEAVKDVPEATLKILGRGREEDNLKKLITDLELSDRVSITDTVDSIDDFVSDLDVFVLPSREHDPFGISAAEAMMRGITTIVTDACGISRHFKREWEAITVEANSAEALRKAVDRMLLEDRREEIGEAGQVRAKETYSLESMIDQYEQLLS